MMNRLELLKFVIDYLKRNYNVSSKIAIQKTLYFLKQRNFPIDYTFGAYTYGPFSKEIMQDADRLASQNQIIINDINYDVDSDSQINLSEQEMENISSFIDEFAHLINSNFDFNNLELIASVIYCIETLNEFGEDINFENVFEELKHWKRHKYNSSEARSAYNVVSPYFVNQ